MIKNIFLILLYIIILLLAWKVFKIGISIIGTIAVLCLVVWVIKNFFWSNK